MGMYKNWLIKIEDLVWEAIEKGLTSEDEVHSYVSMLDARASLDTVEHILRSIHEYHGEEIAA